MPLPNVPIVAGVAAAYGAKKALESSKGKNTAKTSDRTEKEHHMTDDETLNYLCTKLEQRTSERLSPLLERGINARDGDGKTALMHATSTLSQPATSLQSLIEAGADVNARDNDGKTALTLAQETGLDDVSSCNTLFPQSREAGGLLPRAECGRRVL